MGHPVEQKDNFQTQIMALSSIYNKHETQKLFNENKHIHFNQEVTGKTILAFEQH